MSKRSAQRRVLAALAGAGLLALAGCSGSPAASGTGTTAATASASAASTSPADYGCLSPEQATGSFQLQLQDQPTTADAFVTGHGRTGIVFSHMAGETLCEWAPFASAFAAKGYTALAFTSVGPTDENIASAVRELKRRGVTRVLLVGGSKGGTASLVAASRPLALPVVAVVSLSGPQFYEAMDASVAVPKLMVPVLFQVDSGDHGFAEDARALAGAAKKSPHHELRVYPGTAHASAVLGDPSALADFNHFISTYAAPR